MQKIAHGQSTQHTAAGAIIISSTTMLAGMLPALKLHPSRWHNKVPHAAFILLFHSLMSRHINSPKKGQESLAIMIATTWWQGTKEAVQKFFMKADFMQTETIEPGTTTYDEEDSK